MLKGPSFSRNRFLADAKLKVGQNKTMVWNALLSHLDVSTGVDFMNGVARGAPGFSIQIVALNEHCMIAQTAHPHVAFTFAFQLHTFADVKPKNTKNLIS